ncbi:hypothetical protein C2845_PM11G06810 [Panicum miliaceum]|uniref:Uncharacterized protein n=1 Tax=Panicum miliaceum TaxID=4540 RepID=A0A3L6RS94_PANMI|nr:hypothetical protein C2845_PM11G06810 [Panicum miliaceum]
MRAPGGGCVCGVCGAHAGALDRAIGNGRRKSERTTRTGKGKLTGDCSRRSSLPAGGGSLPGTARGGARAGAWSGGACVRSSRARVLCVTVGVKLRSASRQGRHGHVLHLFFTHLRQGDRGASDPNPAAIPTALSAFAHHRDTSSGRLVHVLILTWFLSLASDAVTATTLLNKYASAAMSPRLAGYLTKCPVVTISSPGTRCSQATCATASQSGHINADRGGSSN